MKLNIPNLRALLAAATPAPWYGSKAAYSTPALRDANEANKELIAAARNSLPDALALIDELAKALALCPGSAGAIIACEKALAHASEAGVEM